MVKIESYYRAFSHVFFLVLCIFSILFYKERIIYIDSANYITNIIQTGYPLISGRYGALFSQLLPLLAIKAGLSLKAVLISYSLSFILLFYLVFLVCVYILKNTGAGIIIVLILSLCVRDTFYYAVTEMHQGMVFSVFLYAWLYSPLNNETQNKLVKTIVPLAVVILCFITYPATIFPLLFTLFFFLIEKRQYFNFYYYIVLFFTIALFLTKALLTSENAPEGREYAQILNFSESLVNIFELPAIVYLKGHSGTFTMIYVYFEIILLSLSLFYIYSKNYLKLSLMWIFTISYTVVNAILHSKGDSGIVLEKSFIPLGFFVALPFASDLLPKLKINSYLILSLFVIILFLRIRDISLRAKVQRERLAYISSVCNYARNLKGQKFFFKQENLNHDKILINWAFGMESLLMSSLESPDSSITIFLLKDFTTVKDFSPEKIYLCPFYPVLWNVSELNHNYFRFSPGALYKTLPEKPDL